MSGTPIVCRNVDGTAGVIVGVEDRQPVVRWEGSTETSRSNWMVLRDIRYRGFEIEAGYSAFAPWVFAVEGYDGAPDAGPGNVCGYADRFQDVAGAIDELIELHDLEESEVV